MDSKRLHELAPLSGQAQQWAEICVLGVSSDSRLVQLGDLFISCLGESNRQRRHIEQAQVNGAVAVAIDAQQALNIDPAHFALPIIGVPNLATIQGQIAALINNQPSQHLSLIGITGTNGKTSCSHFIAQCLSELGSTCGVMGTLGYGLLNALETGPNTTPDAVTLQAHLGAMVRSGAQACALEVSSHGLAQGRLNGCRFETAVFTNLTQDHLDYHGTMQAYGEVKAQLFSWPSLRFAVINFDDDFGRGLVNEISPSVHTYTYSAQISQVDYVDLGVASITQHKCGMEALVITPKGSALLQVGLMGRFNLSNLLASLAVLLLHKIDLAAAISVLNKLTTICGRMQLIGSAFDVKTKPQVIVDYAHTPDALEQALMAAKEHLAGGQLWVVFGCGGDRDADKRPKMAAIAETLADHVVITDDNPRTESSEAILAGISQGFKRLEKVLIKGDRRRAITLTIKAAKAGDIVLIAGKGHEDYQDIQGHKYPFSDQEEALVALAGESF